MFDIFGIDALSVLVFGPALSAFFVASLAAFVPSKAVGRWTALLLSLLLALVAIVVFVEYQAAAAGLAIGDDPYIVAQDSPWFEAIGARWTLGIDGISAVMILLTGILTPLAILASWNVEDRSNMHLALLLFFETGSMGLFAAMDLMVFFLFYELTLVPMYFLINQWGSMPKAGLKYSGRFYASTKFMIYSFGGTLGMLLATQLIGWSAGSYNIAALTESWPLFRQGEALLGLDVSTVKALAFAGFFVAFSIKVPIWPFHTWLPDAHGEAPTAGSMLLAGVMLKLGAYGFIRLVIPFFPDVWLTQVAIIGVNVATLFAMLSVAGIVLGAFAAFGQNDIKRLVAYSSVNHMGFVGIGIAVMAQTYAQLWTGADPNAARAADGRGLHPVWGGGRRGSQRDSGAPAAGRRRHHNLRRSGRRHGVGRTGRGGQDGGSAVPGRRAGGVGGDRHYARRPSGIDLSRHVAVPIYADGRGRAAASLARAGAGMDRKPVYRRRGRRR